MQRQQRGGLELAEDEVAIARRPGQPDPTSVVGTPDRGTAAPRATVGYVPRPPGGLTIAPLWPPPAFGTIGASAAGGAGAGAGCARRRGRTSRYRGVSLKAGRKRNPWKAVITVHNQTKHLGYFASEELAAAAYDSVAGEYGRETNLRHAPALHCQLPPVQQTARLPHPQPLRHVQLGESLAQGQPLVGAGFAHAPCAHSSGQAYQQQQQPHHGPPHQPLRHGLAPQQAHAQLPLCAVPVGAHGCGNVVALPVERSGGCADVPCAVQPWQLQQWVAGAQLLQQQLLLPTQPAPCRESSSSSCAQAESFAVAPEGAPCPVEDAVPSAARPPAMGLARHAAGALPQLASCAASLPSSAASLPTPMAQQAPQPTVLA